MTNFNEVELGKTKIQFIDGDRSSRYPKRDEFVEEGIMFLNAESINSGSINKAAANYISEEKFSEIKKGRIKCGDLLLTTRGNGVGNVAYVNTNDLGLINAQMLILRANENEINSKFLFYYFSSTTLYSYIQNFASGSAQPQIPIRDLKKIPLFLPSLKNQEKIGAILSAYDDLIENNKKRIQILENIAEELYKEWFVRFRFPNYEKTEFEKGIPKDWIEQYVSGSFDIFGGGTPSKEIDEYWVDGEVNWYTPSDLTKHNSLFIESSELKCNETGLNKSSAKLFPPYSIMMTSRATIGVLSINTTEACTNQGFITCIPNKEFPLTYLYFWLKFAKPYLEILASGATFAELSRGNFKKVKLLKPQKLLTESFEKICRPIFDEVLNLQKQNRLLNEQKDILLPRLISGKLSVENLDIQFPISMQEK